MLHLYIGCLFWLATTESSKYGKLKVSGESTLKETFPYFFETFCVILMKTFRCRDVYV